MISYNAQRNCNRLTDYAQKSEPKGYRQEEDIKMSEELNWDSALAGEGKYVKLEEGKRKTLVGKNVRFSEVEKEFKGQEPKTYVQVTLDIVEEDNVECQKELNTLSKRFIAGLRKVFEGVDPEVEKRFTVKKIGVDTNTAYDVELVE